MKDVRTREYRLQNKKDYYLLLVIFLSLFLLNIYLPTQFNPFYLHLSNFAVTGSLFLAIHSKTITKTGYTKLRLILIMAPFAILNIVVEAFMNVADIRIANQVYRNINTSDLIDAAYGIMALAVLFLLLTRTRNQT